MFYRRSELDERHSVISIRIRGNLPDKLSSLGSFATTINLADDQWDVFVVVSGASMSTKSKLYHVIGEGEVDFRIPEGTIYADIATESHPSQDHLKGEWSCENGACRALTVRVFAKEAAGYSLESLNCPMCGELLRFRNHIQCLALAPQDEESGHELM